MFHVNTSQVKHASPEAPRAYGRRLASTAPRRCRRALPGGPPCNRLIAAGVRGHVCDRCRVAQARGLEVTGPCACCGSKDLRVLSLVTLRSGPAVLCANDRSVLGRLDLTLLELCEEVRLGAAAAA
jgi:hypothetical protein